MRYAIATAIWGIGAALGSAPSSLSSTPPPDAARSAQVIFLGEQHDNPAHHNTQAVWVSELAPTALVFEMLTKDQAVRITAENRQSETELEKVLDWQASGWPEFSMYFPIFAAAPDAAVYGAAVPRSRLGDMMQKDLADVAGQDITARYGLNAALPEPELTERLELKRIAHCNALPEEMLPRMVDVQRLRDAVIADAARQALAETGGPVVVITGNGHARDDWGAPFLLRRAQPDIAVFTLGQGEAGSEPQGGFTFVSDAPSVDRGDPCDAFK